ncbi:MAG: hypothetical protein R3B97_04390 [Dehalococcoidia bacterium]
MRKSRRLLFLPAAALGLLGLAGLAGQPVANAQAPTLNVDAGAGQDGNWTNLYLPSSVTVETGTTVQWTIKSGEVHSITFILGQPPAEPVATPSGGSIPDETFCQLLTSFPGRYLRRHIYRSRRIPVLLHHSSEHDRHRHRR